MADSFRTLDNANRNVTVSGTTHDSASSFGTTAALAQGEAPNVNVAKTVSENANQEHNAAEEAAKKARELGERFTGQPGGDASDEAVKQSLQGATTSVNLDQVYPSGSDASEKASGMAQDAAGSAKGALNTASNKASEAANTVTSNTSQAANLASNKASEAYNAAASTASSAANTASNAANTASSGAAQAGNAAFTTASDTAQSAGETGTGLVGSLQNTATGAVNMAGGYLASARDMVLESVGMGGSAATGDKGSADMGVPAKTAPLESGKQDVDAMYSSKAAAGVNVEEVGSTPSARN